MPITFEPAGAATGQAVQYVGRGEGMTVLLESDGIGIAVPERDGGAATPSTLKLRLVRRGGAAASSTGIATTNGYATEPPARRKRRRGSSAATHTRRHRKGKSLRKPTPSHKGQAPGAQHAPKPSAPRQARPAGRSEIPERNRDTSEAKFAWRGAAVVPGETNYFLGNDPAKWRTHVQHFATAEAQNVLPGVDIVAYGNAEGVEYDLRVAPGANPSDLRLEIVEDGAARSADVQLDASGDLVMTLDGRELRMKKPSIYEEWAAGASQPMKRKQIDGGYEMMADGRVAFFVGHHDPDATLVFDPSLTVAYTTFLGGADNDIAQSIALDSTGNVYIGGTTSSAATFTETGVTLGPAGGSDFFIAKINPSLSGASSLVYLTFIGGSGTEAGGKIAVDSSGNVAVVGTSTSADYPTTDGSALTAGMNGTAVNDAAVTEIDPTGAKLVYSTLFGGNGNEASLSSGGVAMDSAGEIYVAMDTASTNLAVAPAAAPGPFSSVYGGGASDGFLAVFRPVVTETTPHLKYCTYLGIDSIATVTSIAVDSVGNAYLAGYTQTDPIGTLRTTNGFQATYGGNGDGFVMKILPSGNGVADLSYGTFLGGGGMDQALAITVGTQLPGTAYVTGTTQSKDFPVTGTNVGNITAYQTALGGSANAFLAVIGQNSAGVTSLIYSSYLGGETTDVGLGVWFKQINQIYVSGSTTSANFPAQFNFQPFTGDQDAFVTELDPTSSGAASLVFSTPLGGTSVVGASATATAVATAIAADAAGNVYVAGATTAGDFPMAGNPNTGLQLTCASCQQSPPLNDAFLVKIAPSTTAMPSVTLNTGKVNFGAQPVGSLTIPPQGVVVRNTGDAPLNISSVTLAGPNSSDFSLQGPTACTSGPIPSGNMCSFEVGFVPSAVGPESTFIVFEDDAPTTSQALQVVGAGDGPFAAVSPLVLNFGNQAEGTTTTLGITLTNVGTQQLVISNIPPISGPDSAQFSLAISGSPTSCASVPPGQTCALSVSFKPSTTGAFSGQVTFVDNSGSVPGAEQVVSVTGTATGAAPILTITPTSLSFGTQPVGITSGVQIVTLANSGSNSLNLTSFAITGKSSTNFGYFVAGASPCPLPSGALAAGARCTVSVDFTPQANGPVSATFSISDNAARSPQSVSLSGIGGTSGVSLSPNSLNFATQTVGTPSGGQTVTVANSGTLPVALTVATVGANPGDFPEPQGNTCSLVPLAGGKTCTIFVTFDPTQSGSRAAVLQISDAALQILQTVALSGTAVQATATITPSGTIGFGNALAGTASSPVTVTITNSGAGAAILSVGAVTVKPSGLFTAVNNCTAGIPAAGSCTLLVTFTPPAAPAAAPCGSTVGPKSATLTIADNAPTSPQTIALSGTATDYCLAPAGAASQTVTAGAPATYQLIADSQPGFAGAIALSCADAASLSTCTVTPATANLASGGQVPIVLTVATAANTDVPPGRTPDARRFDPAVASPPATGARATALWLLALLLVIVAWGSIASREATGRARFAQTGAMAVLLAIGLAACFGSGTASVAPAGTPAGTYTMTVTGTFTGAGGSTTRNVQVTLVVQ